MDGFFVAKMEKFQGGSRGVEEDSEDEETAPVTSEASDLGFNSGQDKKAVATEKKGEAEKPAKKQKQKTSKSKNKKETFTFLLSLIFVKTSFCYLRKERQEKKET
jgi:hypothetical protein